MRIFLPGVLTGPRHVLTPYKKSGSGFMLQKTYGFGPKFVEILIFNPLVHVQYTPYPYFF